MTKIVVPFALLGFWMLVAGLPAGDATLHEDSLNPNNIFKLSDMQAFYEPCNKVNGKASRTSNIFYTDKSPNLG